MTRPDQLYRFRRTNSSTSRISSRSKPVILRRPRCPCSYADVLGSIDGSTEDFVLEEDIVGHNSGSKMVIHRFKHIQYFVKFGVEILSYDLKRTKALSS